MNSSVVVLFFFFFAAGSLRNQLTHKTGEGPPFFSVTFIIRLRNKKNKKSRHFFRHYRWIIKTSKNSLTDQNKIFAHKRFKIKRIVGESHDSLSSQNALDSLPPAKTFGSLTSRRLSTPLFRPNNMTIGYYPLV